MISGTAAWNAALAAPTKQPIYTLAIPAFSITLTSQQGATATGAAAKGVRNYWPGNLNTQLAQTLTWLLNQQGETGSNWNANALDTGFPGAASGAPYVATSPPLVECGFTSIDDLNAVISKLGYANLYQQTAFENIVMTPPSGQLQDAQGGPDGYPIDYAPGLGYFDPVSPISSAQIAAAFSNLNSQYPSGNTICGTHYANPDAFTVYGTIYALQQSLLNYRVDLFIKTDIWYYQGSAVGTGTYSSGPCMGQIPVPSPWQNLLVASGVDGIWAVNVGSPGLVLAVLYPTTVSQPAPGSSFSTIPAGWLCHTNTGVGQKLSNFFARVFSKTDIEYLQEDNIPIVAQDEFHARCGSSVQPAAGTLTVQVIFKDPVNGNVEVFDSLAATSAFASLPRSFTVPPSDPLYSADPALSNVAALQDRSYIYDCALAILAYSASANFTAAAKIVSELSAILSSPEYQPSLVLENAEDGSTARWTPVSGTVANVGATTMAPEEPPYGSGQVIKFSSTAANATFTYAGSGFPDTTDAELSFEHYEPKGVAFQFDIGVTSTGGKVTDIAVTSGTAGAATYNSTTKTITVPIGAGLGNWRVTLVNIGNLISTLASDTLASITSFKATLTASTTIMYFDNLTVGGLQPANSLSFSYDVFYGLVDQAYIRTGSMAWVCYAFALYMQLSGDWSPALSLQAMLNFLLTLQSTAVIAAPSAPSLGSVAGGALAPTTYFCKITYTNAQGETTPSTESSKAVAANNLLTVASPATETGATGWNVYVSTSAGTETKQNSTPIAIGTGWTEPTSGLISGAALPGSNTAGDLTRNLFYLGYGKYQNPGYQYVPGKILTVSTEHQVDIYFAFVQAAAALNLAAPALLKAGQITSTQNTSLLNSATQVSGIATTVASQVIANLYIAPGAAPGHFAQGATGFTLDPSYALDASGYLTAIMCDAVARDDLALQCVEFMWQTFHLTGQTIIYSNGTNTWNEAYQQLTPFEGMKTFADSAGGYSGSPASVWGEGTWGFILALLRLYNIAGLQSYFTGLGTSIDTVLGNLMGAVGQYLELATTQNGSLIQHAAASRDLPWEFEVWPGIADTAWLWCVATNINLLLSASATLPATLLDDLIIPTGPSVTPNELEGSAAIGAMTVECIDPTGIIKSLGAGDALIGKVAQLAMNFPGLPSSDQVTLHTFQVSSRVGWTPDGKVVIPLSDVQRFIQGQQIWWAGGPSVWAPGQPTPPAPVGPAAGPNAFPVSNKNPRYVQGNPIDIALAALQNELGVGQDPNLFTSNFISQQLAPVYATQQNYAPPPYPAGWAVFKPGTDSTLINPNTYINIPQWLNVRNTLFSGVWLEFVITRPQDGKQFVEQQILKPLGLYMVPNAAGQIILKSMKPTPYQAIAFTFNSSNIIGIPEVGSLELKNQLTAKTDVDNSGLSSAARSYGIQLTFNQSTSITRYHVVAAQNLESTGLRLNYASGRLSRWLADVTFRRHSFKPPTYRVKAQLASLVAEAADLVTLSHPLVPDEAADGKLGLSTVTCEVLDRRPNYGQGYMEFLLGDTRFFNEFTPYQVAASASGIPAWGSATAAQRQQYMFIALGAMSGENPDGTPGNTIY